MNAFIATLVMLFTLFFVALGAPVDSRDVFVPPLLTPTTGAVLKAGQTMDLHRDTSKAPKQITNRKGRIILAFKTRLVGLSSPLAQDFDILLGKFNVTVPKNTAPGKERTQSWGILEITVPSFRHIIDKDSAASFRFASTDLVFFRTPIF